MLLDENGNEIEGALPSEEVAEEEAVAESETAETEVETEEVAEDSTGLDFETELEKERERLGKKIDKERDKRIAAEKLQGLSREDAEKLIDERVLLSERRLMRGRAEQLASQMAGSEAEKNLILLHYDNSIIPSGNIEEDMDKAYALANLKRVKGTISELKKAAIHKKTLSSNSDAGQPVERKPIKKYSQDIIDGAKFAGKTPEEFAKELEK